MNIILLGSVAPSAVQPKYIEVLAQVPIMTSGYSVVIIEFAD